MAAPLKGPFNLMLLLNSPRYGTQESLAMYCASYSWDVQHVVLDSKNIKIRVNSS